MQGAQTSYLVSCVSRKRTSSARAKDLYLSEWFLRARAYVERTALPWYILSSKYGLISPDQMIDPYEQTLNRMSVGERRAWANHVGEQIRDLLPEAKHVVMFAGMRYREFLLDYLRERGLKVEVPLEGLRIGEQLSWLGEQHAHGPSR